MRHFQILIPCLFIWVQGCSEASSSAAAVEPRPDVKSATSASVPATPQAEEKRTDAPAAQTRIPSEPPLGRIGKYKLEKLKDKLKADYAAVKSAARTVRSSSPSTRAKIAGDFRRLIADAKEIVARTKEEMIDVLVLEDGWDVKGVDANCAHKTLHKNGWETYWGGRFSLEPVCVGCGWEDRCVEIRFRRAE